MSLQLVDDNAKGSVDSSVWRSYLQGLTLHLINPKAALVWLATLSVGMEASVHPLFFFVVIGLCSLIAVVVYTGYALVFSTGMISRGYLTMQRPLDLFCGVLFGAAAIKMLTLSV